MIFNSGFQRNKIGGRKAGEEIVAGIQVRNVGGLNMTLEMRRCGRIPEILRKYNLQDLVLV